MKLLEICAILVITIWFAICNDPRTYLSKLITQVQITPNTAKPFQILGTRPHLVSSL